jgi:hypothetical protein
MDDDDTGDVTAVVAVVGVDDATTAVGEGVGGSGTSSVRGRSRMSRTEKLLVLGILIDNSLQERMRRLKGQSREIYVLSVFFEELQK